MRVETLHDFKGRMSNLLQELPHIATEQEAKEIQNTEYQERLFGQANNIARQTSSNHSQHIIYNAVLRIQAEASHTMGTIKQ